MPEIQDSRTGRGGGAVEDYITEKSSGLQALSGVESALAIFKKYILDPTRSLTGTSDLPPEDYYRNRVPPEPVLPGSAHIDAKSRQRGRLSGMGGVNVAEDRALPLPAAGRSDSTEGILDFFISKLSPLLELFSPEGPSMKPRVRDSTDVGTVTPGVQALNVSVTVPEPTSIKVESVVNSNVYLDGRLIATVVRRELARELSRIITNKRYIVPARIGA